MDYIKIHDSIIQRAELRIYDSKIHHKHHIIPKHEDKTSVKTVPLTFKEHKIIHLLRWKITNTVGNRLVYLMYSGMTDEFHRYRSIEGGKKGGKRTKNNKSGIFSDNYDRSKETKRRWEEGIITLNKLNLSNEESVKRGKLSFLSKKGIHSPDYDKSKASKAYWDNLSVEDKEKRKIELLINSKKGNIKAAELKSGFLQPHIQKVACSLGGKSHIGKIWIHNNDSKTRIYPKDLEIYLKNGWKLGSGVKRK